jgi:hypothetical protein
VYIALLDMERPILNDIDSALRLNVLCQLVQPFLWGCSLGVDDRHRRRIGWEAVEPQENCVYIALLDMERPILNDIDSTTLEQVKKLLSLASGFAAFPVPGRTGAFWRRSRCRC